MSFLINGFIVILVIGIPLYIIGVTFLGLGKYGAFGGEKTYFRGVASTKYTSSKIEIKEGKNLNGKLVKTLKVKAGMSYEIKCDINNISGEAKVTLKDKNKDIIGIATDSVVEGIMYSSGENGRIVVTIDFDKFSGEVFVGYK